MTTTRTNAPMNPITGDSKPGTITFCQTPDHSTPLVPDWTSAAPTRPPTSAWVELEGKPSRQVRRFHVIAPSRAARRVWFVVAWIRLFAIVDATAVVTNAPARFAAEETSTAGRGASARVPTHVAM